MAQHHDMLDPERLHGEFEGRRGAVIIAPGLEGRHEVCHIANDEQLAGARIEDHLRRHPAVAAADHHHLRRLTLLGKSLEAGLLAREALIEKRTVSFSQAGRKHGSSFA
jgi:hypothetical protein